MWAEWVKQYGGGFMIVDPVIYTQGRSDIQIGCWYLLLVLGSGRHGIPIEIFIIMRRN